MTRPNELDMAKQIPGEVKRARLTNTSISTGHLAGASLLWAGLLAMLVYVGLSALWALAEVALLMLAAIVLAVVISALAEFVQRAHVSRGLAVVISFMLMLLVATIAGYLLLPTILDEAQALLTITPAAVVPLEREIERVVQRYPLLRTLMPVEQRQHIDLTALVGSIGGLGPGVLGMLSGVFGLVLRAFATLTIALYLSANPTLYIRGAARLVPIRYHARTLEVLYTLGETLRSWLIAQMIAMLIIGTVTWAGLMLLGVPNALALGVLAGFLNIMPNFGPILSWVPAATIAFTQGPVQVLWVTLLFVVVQQIESNFLTPKIMHAKVDLPPVLVISGQLVLATFFGFIGLIMAVPLTAIVVVTVKLLYVEDLLGYGVDVKGEAEGTAQARDELSREPLNLTSATVSADTDDVPGST